MNTSMYFIVFILLLFSFSPGCSDSKSDCYGIWEKKIIFSSVTEKDRFVIGVDGEMCIDSSLTYKIYNKQNVLIFNHAIKLRDLYFDRDSLNINDAGEMAAYIFNRKTGLTSQWPRYPKGKILKALDDQRKYYVTEIEYEQLRNDNIPFLEIDTHYDSSRFIVFDIKTNKAIVIWESWL